MQTYTAKTLSRRVLTIAGTVVGLFFVSGMLQPAQAQIAQCTYYVSPSGSDSGTGSFTTPWLTVKKAFNTATAGQTVCFRAGTYPALNSPDWTCTGGANTPPCYSGQENTSGTAGAPITFTNYPNDTGSAIIQGSIEIHGSYITFRGTSTAAGACSAANPCGVVIEGRNDNATDVADVCCSSGTNPQFVLFDHVELRSGTYHAGFGQDGCNNTITGSYVHDNGNGISDSDHSLDQGIYWNVTSTGCTNGGLIADNIVEHNWAKGIQLYNSASCSNPASVIISGNTITNNQGQGAVIFGQGNVFVNNILYSNNNISGAAGGAQGDLSCINNPNQMPPLAANVVDHNVTYNPTTQSCADWWNRQGFNCFSFPNNYITKNDHADPLFANSSTNDWHLTSGSPAIGWINVCYLVSPRPLDLDGNPRCNPSVASAPSAGAYELH